MSEEIERNEKGQFVGKHKHTFTPDNAREMAKRSHESREENAIRAAEKGLLKGLPPEVVAEDVWGGLEAVFAALTRMVMKEEGHASVRAAEAMFKQLRITPASDKGSGGDTYNITIPPELAIRLEQIREKNEREVVSAPVRVLDGTSRDSADEDEDG